MNIDIYDKNNNLLSRGSVVEIQCNYQNENNGKQKTLSLKYKGVKSEGYDFGEAIINEYYSLLLDGESWDSFSLLKGKNSFKCDSIILVY